LSTIPQWSTLDPQGAGWFFKLRLRDTKAMDGLMDEAAYKKLIE
jgi:glycine cleavage system H protein